MKYSLNIHIFTTWICLFFFYIFPSIFCYDVKNETNNSKNEIFSKYIGKGYDILFGYPLPNNELIEDPGFREVIFDTRNTINVIQNVACKKDEYLKVIKGINDVMDLAMENINIDDLDANIRPFSASMPYSNYFIDLEIKKKKYAVVQNTCLHSYATLNLGESTKTMNKDFLLDTEKLPVLSKKKENKCSKILYLYDSSNEHCLNTIKPWIEFFQKYGTHLLISAHFGGKSFNSLEITMEKSEEINIYKYKYYIGNVTYLNIFKAPLVLQDILKMKISRKHDLIKKKIQNTKEMNLDIRGGNFFDEKWNELTYEIWKNSIYSNYVPVYLDLVSLSSFIRKNKKESYNIALLYYSNLYGTDKENLYLSQNITDVFSEGKQITGSGKGSLILSCPIGYIKSTGFIFSYDTSEKLKNLKNEEPRLKIHPCHNKGEYDISCSYTTKNDNIISFGWMYCVKHNFIKFETIYKESVSSKENSLDIKCSEGNTLAFGFKMKLKKKENLEKIKVKPCNVGDSKCSIDKTKNNSDYLLWGFCVPLSFRTITSLQVTYISEKNVTTDVSGSCSDIYINKYDNIFLGFTFSFDKDLEKVKASSCSPNSKFCISKINNKNEKYYVGMFLLCRYDGNQKRKFKYQ
ncbi:perforin like protein 4, putative [Plasmodium gallinaceum]|uniref:Perforin like protein 4, putative n=1 Tax=Plasmodium gallinaceum TaxID=5849 RepID=A0A1J1GQU9_PLAGA|nr:perforin like protein 4, putative [Plasmodium gallinaceum]CRG93418.1 perforin like protein 4, putative [Plasmodium gallinaceum]